MEVTVYWRKWRRIGKLEVWQFRTGNHFFSCYLRSINKKRRPTRIFEFSAYRPSYDDEEDGFFKEERENLRWRIRLYGRS